MDTPEILAQIKTTETAEIDPDAVAEIYAYALSTMESYITEADFRRLILLGAAMYRNSTKGNGKELQIPHSATNGDVPLAEDKNDGGFLH